MSVSCFIHTLQLVIKDSLFEDDLIKLLLAKVQKLVYHFSHSFKPSKQIAKIAKQILVGVTFPRGDIFSRSDTFA